MKEMSEGMIQTEQENQEDVEMAGDEKVNAGTQTEEEEGEILGKRLEEQVEGQGKGKEKEVEKEKESDLER